VRGQNELGTRRFQSTTRIDSSNITTFGVHRQAAEQLLQSFQLEDSADGEAMPKMDDSLISLEGCLEKKSEENKPVI